MNTRVKILKALNASYPFKLSRSTLLDALKLDDKPIPESEIDADIQTLCANGFIETSRDNMDAAKVYFKICESGIRYLESKGIA